MQNTKKIFHAVKKRFIGPTKINYFTLKKPIQFNWFFLSEKTNIPYIGALPGEIIIKIPESKRGKITNEANEIFTDFALSVSTTGRFEKLDKLTLPLFEKYYKRLEKDLKQLLQCESVFIKYIDSGCFKHCFKIVFNNSNNAYTLQIFKDNGINKRDSYSFPYGARFEPQHYFTIYKKYSHGRIARPFISQPVTETDTEQAYILTKYIDENHTEKQHIGKFISNRHQVTSEDIKRKPNTINGIVIDVGGFINNPKHIANKKNYYIWQSFAQILDAMDFNSYEAYKVSVYLLDLYNKMGEQFFDTTLWPQMIQNLDNKHKKIAKKMLRSLRRLEIKKQSMGPEYNKIKNLLHQDFIDIFDFIFINQEIPYKKGLFYPEIVCKILETDNVPPLYKIASKCANKMSLELSGRDTRVHWNKYYTVQEVQECMKKIPIGLDWDKVLRDFIPDNTVIQNLNDTLIK